ncbi:acyltransferase LovD [Rhypophila decipiens]|uniref:Acyltransferase LovD n=1 Tax=Rhypophila decipiens TaxID=261697 RepID=A0AAN6YBK4_9PEZI|nr:acyltransferase LovD [Rhypophila decipiens]
MTASFSTFEAALEKAIADGVLPGAVVAARDKSGKISYLKSFGQRSLTPGAESPMTVDTIFPLASMTKLITSVCAAQLIDRGLVTPETEVSSHLPVLASLPILQSLTPEGTESSTPRSKPILLRHLLTHSSGLAYPFLHPLLSSRADALTAAGNPPPVGPSVAERHSHPLVFEPGSSWTYGSGIDWAGHLVEVLTGQDLESYLQQHILTPLGLSDTPKVMTFWPEHFTPEQEARKMQFTVRSPEHDNKVIPLEGPPPLYNLDPKRSIYGGEAGYASMTAYIEILYSLLMDDQKLLSSETASLFFKPMLDPDAKKGLLENLKDPSWIVGHLPVTGEYDHSLGGVVVDGPAQTQERKTQRRKNGFLLWGGMFNLAWFIDREAGVTACFATSVVNPADPDIEKLFVALEETVYAEAGVV